MTGGDAPGALFLWTAHPAREHLGRTVLALLVIAALALASGWLMTSPWWALLAAAVMVLALNRFFFPSRFLIDADGITARYPLRQLRYRWSELRRFVHDRYGGYLSTRARRSWLDAYRGMHVQFGSAGAAAITRIRHHLPAPDAAAGGGT